jgi:peptidoglycan hydrolase-like protein with peptidoglycan-binding domain
MQETELIFRRAMASTNVRAVGDVANVFQSMGHTWKAAQLRNHARVMSNVGFGGTTVTVGDVQVKLNALGAQPALIPDGVAGPKTIAAVVAFQSANGLSPDGKVGPLTLAALGFAGAQAMVPGPPSGVQPTAQPTSGRTATIANVRGINKLSPAELKALVDAANWIGINPDWLASAISFESGFSPSIENAAGSGAVGLIQFMPSTAVGLGTSTAALKQMTFTQQLEYVKKYFEPHRGQLHSLEDTYLAIFYPAFIGKPLNAVLGSTGSAIYDQNSGFDRAGKGYVTKEDITSTIRGVLDSAAGRISVPGAVIAGGIGIGGILLAAAAWWLYKRYMA